MAQVEGVHFQVIYEGTDISEDISDSLISLQYTDHAKGKADEFEISLEDSAAKWSNEWFPKKGDRVSIRIGYETELVNCGTFEVDECETSGPPDLFMIRGISSGISKDLRTKKSKAREGKTLQQIAQEIADAHGLTLDVGTHEETRSNGIYSDVALIEEMISALEEAEGLSSNIEQANVLTQSVIPKIIELEKSLKKNGFDIQFKKIDAGIRWLFKNLSAAGISAYIKELDKRKEELSAIGNKVTSKTVANDLHSIVIKRTTQRNETDLAYLSRLAEEYGFAFSIKDKTLLFYNVYDLEGRQPSIHLSKSDLTNYSLKSTTSSTYGSAKTVYHDPLDDEVVEAEESEEPVASPDGEEVTTETADDVLEIKTRTESKQHAEAKSKAGLHKYNSKANQGTITTPLNILLLGGNNFVLSDFGQHSGTYHVITSTHKIEKGSGGSTDCEIKKVIPPAKDKVKKPDSEKGETETSEIYKKVDYIGQGVLSNVPFNN